MIRATCTSPLEMISNRLTQAPDTADHVAHVFREDLGIAIDNAFVAYPHLSSPTNTTRAACIWLRVCDPATTYPPPPPPPIAPFRHRVEQPWSPVAPSQTPPRTTGMPTIETRIEYDPRQLPETARIYSNCTAGVDI